MLITAITCILPHLKAIHDCLDGLDAEEPYKGFFEALMTYFKELLDALDAYIVSPDSAILNRSAMMSSLDFLQRWDNWIVSVPKFKHGASRTMHGMSLRMCKGVLKAWRIWRIDLTKS